MSETNPPRVSFSDKDLENGAPNHDRAASRKWSTAPGAIEDLDEYTALQKYISTYRDPKERAAEEAAANGDKSEAKPKKAWQFWKKGAAAGSGNDGTVPEDWLEADIRQGISNHDVESRRKRFGFNEISSDKENLFIKFLSFFTGPILYGTSLSLILAFAFACRSGLGRLALARSNVTSPQIPQAKSAKIKTHPLTNHVQLWNLLSFSQQVCVIGSISVSSSVFLCSTPSSVGTRRSRLPMSSPLSRVISP
jgi:magnesium-transporting ATPase (P-type)